MKVEVTSEPESATIRSLMYGDVFKFNSDYFMLLDESEDDETEMAARMDGCIVRFLPNTIVIPVKAKVVIE